MPTNINLPANLPENWQISQIVSPSGTDVGLSAQHGYNYLMQQVNDTQEAANTLSQAVDQLGEDVQGILSGGQTVQTAKEAEKLSVPRKINGVAFDGTADITITAAANGGTATAAGKLSTARKINGVAFDGSKDITVTAAANGGTAANVPWSGVTGKPGTFAPAAHNQAASTITAGNLPVGVKATDSTDYGTARLRNIYAGTGAMTPGTTALANGVVYLQYE